MKYYGEMIRAAREARGWSLRDIADAVDMSHSSIADVEKGRRGPSDGMHGALMNALGIADNAREDYDAALAMWRGYVTARDADEDAIRQALRALRKAR